MTSTNRIVANALSRNAKFKEGDLIRATSGSGAEFIVSDGRPDAAGFIEVLTKNGGRDSVDPRFFKKVGKAWNARNAMAQNSVSITRDSRRDNWWVRGTVNGLMFLAKVYDEPSGFGIDHGRVSKLEIRDKDGNIAVTYDRGWDKRPKTAEMKKAYTELVKAMEKLAKAYHPGELLPSRSWNSRRDLGKAVNADVPVGTIITIIDTPFRYGGERGQIVGKLGYKYKVKLIDRQDKPVVELQPNQVGAKNAVCVARNAAGDDISDAGVHIDKAVEALKYALGYKPANPDMKVHSDKISQEVRSLTSQLKTVRKSLEQTRRYADKHNM